MKHFNEKGNIVYTTRFPFPGITECLILVPPDETELMIVSVERVIPEPDETPSLGLLDRMVKNTLFTDHVSKFFPDINSMLEHLKESYESTKSKSNN